MRIKKSVPVLFCLLFLLPLISCRYVPTDESSAIYKSANVEVSALEGMSATNYTNYEWAVFTDDIAYTKNTVIITGVASNVQQATVAYEYMDTDVLDNITIFDIEISDVLSSRSGSFQQGDTITVGVGYNMNKYGEGLPIIESGKEYMVFCYVAADKENDVLELAEYIDCWVSAPKDLLLERVGDFYLSIDYFSDAPGSHGLLDYVETDEEEISLLSSISAGDADAASVYIDNDISAGIQPNVEEAADALFVLWERTMDNSKGLWNLANRAYLIGCDELENYVRNTAQTYVD